MAKFRLKAGWTKAKVMRAFKRGNNGTVCEGSLPNSCAYLNSDGNKCAVGVFIPKKRYNKDIEGQTAHSVFMDYPGLKDFMPLSAEGMNEMQEWHDSKAKQKFGGDTYRAIQEFLDVRVA